MVVEARKTLADVLREDLGLTGTHLGCEHGVCGACTVLVDGEAVRSCLMFAVQADGADVVTVEGLRRTDGQLSDVQAAMHAVPRPAVRVLHAGLRRHDHRAPRARPRSRRRRDPRRAVRQPVPLHRLPGHRQGGPQAAATARSGSHERRRAGNRFVGQRVQRREDARLLTGHGRYVDDITMPGLLHVAFVRSDVACGTITALDVSAARAAARRRRRVHRRRPQRRRRRVLGRLRGRRPAAGRSACSPTATSASSASRSCSSSPSPATSPRTPATSSRSRSTRSPPSSATTPRSRPGRDRSTPSGPTTSPTACPTSRTTSSSRSSRPPPTSSPRRSPSTATCACPWSAGAWCRSGTRTGNELLVHTSTQGPHGVRGFLSRAVGLPENRVRVVMQDVGGGFGQKMFMLPDEVAVVVAGKRLGRPVKWIEDRRENLLAGQHARDDKMTVSCAVDDGRAHPRRARPTSSRTSARSRPPAATRGGFVGMLFTGPVPHPEDVVLGHRRVHEHVRPVLVPRPVADGDRRPRADDGPGRGRDRPRPARVPPPQRRPRRRPPVHDRGRDGVLRGVDRRLARAGRRDDRLRRSSARSRPRRGPRARCSGSGSGCTSSRRASRWATCRARAPSSASASTARSRR